VDSSTYQYVAEAIGSNGVYEAAKSPVFTEREGNKVMNGKYKRQLILEELIQKLVQEGWESTGIKTEYSVTQSFRRRMK
jgi:hypothetical protein